MDMLRPHQQLHIQTPDQQTLSVCDASPNGLVEWIADLPKANLGETARLLHKCLLELNQLDTSTATRMQLLELLRPEVLAVCRQLERHFLNQSAALDERQRKVANLCQALQQQLAIGYKLIVVQDANNFHKEHSPQLAVAVQRSLQLAVAVQRSLHSLFGLLIHASQLYCPVDQRLWQEMHLLYQTACSFKLQQLPISDPLSPLETTQSVENAYLAALMLGCARTNQMRQSAITKLAEVIAAWTPLVRMEPADSPAALFWVATDQDAPPAPKSRLQANEQHKLLGINPGALLDAIREHLQPAEEAPAPEQPRRKLAFFRRAVVKPAPVCLAGINGLPAEQLEHLCAAWGLDAGRTSQRVPAQEQISLCIGMTSIHYFIAGEKTFGNVMSKPLQPNSVLLNSPLNDARETDIWARSFDASATAKTAQNEQIEDINYQSTDYLRAGIGSVDDMGDEEEQQRPPIHKLQVINQTPGGYCLSWPSEVSGQLQAGELLGIQDSTGNNWNLAAVRWIQQVRGEGTQMGVQLMAPSVQPCGLQLIRKGAQNSQFLRALLIPQITSIGQAASLITPRIPFREGHKVLLSLGGMQRRAILGKPQLTTGSFIQFAYRSQYDPAGDLTQGTTAAKAGEEDFDSLWKSL